MKQVCPVYRVQFKVKRLSAMIRQTDRQTDRISLSFSVTLNMTNRRGLPGFFRAGRAFVRFYDWG